MKARRLIVTADDFGMSLEVNEAVELAHREGILTTASLVVSGDAAADAVRRARRMPGLGVGLHLALLDAPATVPVVSPIAPDGAHLGTRPAATGAAIMLSREVRAAARREIAAQFEAYRKTGLELGHLDGHWHFHQHPAVLKMAIELGKPFGLKAIRIPFEPYRFSREIGGDGLALGRLGHVVGHALLARAMRRRIAAAGLVGNDRFFGKNDAGAVSEELLTRLVERLPPGVTEVGLHPATSNSDALHALPASWQPARELAALISPSLRRTVEAQGVELCRWADIG